MVDGRQRCLVVVSYDRGRGSKGRSRKRSFGDDGAIAGASGKEQSPARSPRPWQQYHHTLVVHSETLSSSTPLNHTILLLSTNNSTRSIAPLAPRRIAASSRPRQSRSFDRHIFLSISAHSYKPTLGARHHSTLPAEWPFSLPLRPRPLTSISQTSINPRSLRNPSTTPLPPPWIKKSPSLRKCCPPSLAAF